MKEIHLKYKIETGKELLQKYNQFQISNVIDADSLSNFNNDGNLKDIIEEIRVYEAVYVENLKKEVYTEEYVQWLEEENERLQKQLNPFLGIVNK